jgi:transcriptional regulator with XRE-family HTH domain
MADFPGEVRRLMAERGMSLRGLAKAASYDPSYLSKVLSGQKPHNPQLAARIDDALGAGGAIKATAATFNGSLTPGERDRLAWTARRPGHADEAVLESLAQVLAAQRKAEDALGSTAVLRPVLAQLAVVDTLAAEARGPLRPAVIGVAQQWAQFAGWLHLNLADHRKSAARFRQALEHATEIGDHTMVATVLSFRGYAAWRAGQPGPAIGLAQAARQDPQVALSQRTYAAVLEARGHALAGDAAAAERLIGEALELAGELDGRPDQNRPWSYWYSLGFFQCQGGIALSQFAHIPRLRDRATSMLLAGYESLPGDEKLSEWAGTYLAVLAHVYERSGDVGPACAVALDAAMIMRRTRSARLAGMLREVLAALTMRWPHDPHVAELREALR